QRPDHYAGSHTYFVADRGIYLADRLCQFHQYFDRASRESSEGSRCAEGFGGQPAATADAIYAGGLPACGSVRDACVGIDFAFADACVPDAGHAGFVYATATVAGALFFAGYRWRRDFAGRFLSGGGAFEVQ